LKTTNIQYIDVSKRFGAVQVVDGLNLEVQEGEFVVLLGPSGCGKTTTLRMLAGLESTSAGDILIGGERVNEVPTQHRDLAMVFQNYALYPHMTVERNIGYPLRIKKVAGPERRQRVERVAELLGIGKLLQRTPRELSGGERQRVALARAIVREPRAFLMDEPLSNLDAKLRTAMRGELKRLQHDLGTTTVYVTHDQAEAMTLAHRVAVMHDGRLQQFAPPLDIYHQPENRFVAEFVGSPGMNFIDGRVDFETRRLVGDGISLELSATHLDDLIGYDRVSLGIRAEDITLSPVPNSPAVAGSVFVVEVFGSESNVFIDIGLTRLVARTDAEFRFDPESPVWVTLDLKKAFFFEAETGNRIV
jgi:multiple sugar transport system ATP-binding protein